MARSSIFTALQPATMGAPCGNEHRPQRSSPLPARTSAPAEVLDLLRACVALDPAARPRLLDVRDALRPLVPATDSTAG